MTGPNPTYRTTVGVAKDSVNTTLAAAAAASATTISVASATGITTSSTVIIFDGPLTETRAVSGVSGTTLTVAALTYAHPANTYVVAQLTASVGPTDYIPVESVDWSDEINQITDKGWRGSNVEEYGSTDGTAYAQISLSGAVFPDTFGYLIGGFMGATDFTGGTPNQHDFSVKNTGDCQPTGQVLYVAGAVNTRAIAMARYEEVSLTYDPAGFLMYTAKAIGQPSGIVTTPTSSFSTVAAAPNWRTMVTLNSVASSTLLSASLQFKRKAVTPIFTQRGVQGPVATFAGPVKVTGKATFLFMDETELALFLNNTQGALDLNFAQGSGASATATVAHCTKVNFDSAKQVYGKDWLELDTTFTALANTTDATTAGTGNSPAKVTLKNAKATGTYL